MMRRPPLSTLPAALAAACCLLLLLATGCSRHPALTRVQQGDRDGTLYLGNYGEPRELDPALATGIPETNILYALEEGLVRADQTDLHPTPGDADHWEISPDQLTYTFHLRPDAKWSNGEPITAPQYVRSWQRALSPQMAGELSYYLDPLKNAEKYRKGTLKDFTQVGVHAVDDHTLRLDLEHPTPFLFRLLLQRFYFPVYLPGIEKTGKLDDRSNLQWTRPGNYVGNGPYVLTDWRVNQQIVVQKNSNYWNAKNIRIREVRYYPIDDGSAEEAAFRGGLLHKTSSGNVSPSKLDTWRREQPSWVHVDPYLGVYFYMLNTTRPPLDDVRIRQALSLSIDRESIVKNITRAGEKPAYHYTPPDTAGYTARAHTEYNPDAARKLLAEAGHPGGLGLPPLPILFNTSEVHSQIAQAIQAMWSKELGVTVNLNNEEWKVYLNDRTTMNYTICRAGWIGSFDPSFFLENMLSGGTNNQTGFASPQYDALIDQARAERDPATRYEDFQQSEKILMDAMPVIPLYFYTNSYLLRPSVRGWHGNPIDYHPFEDLSLQP